MFCPFGQVYYTAEAIINDFTSLPAANIPVLKAACKQFLTEGRPGSRQDHPALVRPPHAR